MTHALALDGASPPPTELFRGMNPVDEIAKGRESGGAGRGRRRSPGNFGSCFTSRSQAAGGRSLSERCGQRLSTAGSWPPAGGWRRVAAEPAVRCWWSRGSTRPTGPRSRCGACFPRPATTRTDGASAAKSGPRKGSSPASMSCSCRSATDTKPCQRDRAEPGRLARARARPPTPRRRRPADHAGQPGDDHQPASVAGWQGLPPARRPAPSAVRLRVLDEGAATADPVHVDLQPQRRHRAVGDLPLREPPVTARGMRTRAALVAAARRVFERDGYIDARVTDITREAACSTGNFYTYFAGKEEVVHAVLESV